MFIIFAVLYFIIGIPAILLLVDWVEISLENYNHPLLHWMINFLHTDKVTAWLTWGGLYIIFFAFAWYNLFMDGVYGKQ